MNYIKIAFSTVFIFSTFFTAFAQDVYLHSQAEVDAFDKSITAIKGSLNINGDKSSDPIKNLDGLSQVTRVDGGLGISENSSLTNLDGLSNLTSIGYALVITGNNALTNIDGLSNIKTVHDILSIKGNSSLRNLDGLSNLTSIDGRGYLYINKNKALKNINGLSQLTRVGAIVLDGNTSLTNIDGLSNITSVGDRGIFMQYNSSLSNIDGLSKVTIVEGQLHINTNISLEHLDGLSKLTSVGSLLIEVNNSLANIDGLSSLTSIKGDASIATNPLIKDFGGLSQLTTVTGYLSIRYNSSLRNLDGLSNLTKVDGGLTVVHNPALYDCCGIQHLLSKAGAAIMHNASSCDSESDVLFSDCSGEEVVLKTQAQVDAFDKRIPYCKGDIRIDGHESPDPIRNLDGLSNLRAAYNMNISEINVTNLDGLSNLNIIGNQIYIITNPNLTNLDGLSNLKAVNGAMFIYENQKLGNCCAIQSALSTALGASIEDNAAGCKDESNILSSCNPAQPDEGEEVDVSNYKENLWQLTRWELANCGTNQTYKFAENGTVRNTGRDFGTYAVNDKTLTLTPTGGTAQRYTISKMTTNVMHLIDASGTETIYGRRQHIEDRIIGTNWREQGGAHDQMRMKFVDDKNAELITIGSKGSKIAATYALSNGNKTLTITFSDPAKAKEQGFPATLVLTVKTFNYMMMKLEGDGVVICFNRA